MNHKKLKFEKQINIWDGISLGQILELNPPDDARINIDQNSSFYGDREDATVSLDWQEEESNEAWATRVDKYEATKLANKGKNAERAQKRKEDNAKLVLAAKEKEIALLVELKAKYPDV